MDSEATKTAIAAISCLAGYALGLICGTLLTLFGKQAWMRHYALLEERGRIRREILAHQINNEFSPNLPIETAVRIIDEGQRSYFA